MNMALTAIKKESIGEQVLAQMKEQILNGEWKEGMKIPSENQLCDTFGVSRVTVRQAIQKLVAQGLLETRLGEGSYVKGFDLGSFIRGVIPVSYTHLNPEKDRFSAQTKQKVVEAAEKLRYVPASYAQQMKGKEISVLGLIICLLYTSRCV